MKVEDLHHFAFQTKNTLYPRVIKAIQEKGYPSVLNFVNVHKIPPNSLYYLLNGKIRPFNGTWSDTAQKVSDALDLPLVYLFGVHDPKQITRRPPSRPRPKQDHLQTRAGMYPAVVRAMRAKGYTSVQEFSRRTGVPTTTVFAAINGERAPFTVGSGWSRAANDLATALDCLPEDLFGDQGGEMPDITNYDDHRTPDENVDMGRRRAVLSRILEDLPEDKRDLLNMHLDGLTMDEIGQRLGVSRQAVSMALKKLLGVLTYMAQGMDYRTAYSARKNDGKTPAVPKRA